MYIIVYGLMLAFYFLGQYLGSAEWCKELALFFFVIWIIICWEYVLQLLVKEIRGMVRKRNVKKRKLRR